MTQFVSKLPAPVVGHGCCPSSREPSSNNAKAVDQQPVSIQQAESTCDRTRRDDVIWFDGGVSSMGTDVPEIKADGEGPRRKTGLKPFGMDRYAVTNERFAAFVAATGYRTDAERFGWSYVFNSFIAPSLSDSASGSAPWWRSVDGAYWSRPEGPSSSTNGRERHPVVHISWNDAAAFAKWCGGRLPTEAEWEHGARGGAPDRRFPWGNDEPTDTAIFCNIWQGDFPNLNTAIDGFTGTAPVDAFAPNPAGLYNCCGNTWEWCVDPFHVRSLSSAGRARDLQAVTDKERTLKGGSYLCHRSYCYRYRIAARTGRPRDTSAGHTGFRLAYDVVQGSKCDAGDTCR